MLGKKSGLNIGVFGGTFNPPHLGHKNAAITAIRALELNKMLIIPAANPPHKTMPDGSATADQRLEMTRIFAGEIPKCQVLDIELERGGKSYTFETIEQLEQMFEDANFWLILGSDMFLTFDKWRNPDAIAKVCRLAVMLREDMPSEEILKQKENLAENFGAETDFVDIEIMPISSTDARASVVRGNTTQYLAPKICKFITENALYGSNPMQNPPAEMFEYVRARLSLTRYKHTLGCVDYAAKLARIYGENEYNARTAALLHDVTKELTYTGQLKLCKKYGIITNYSENEARKLLHADTASAIARNKFSVNPQIAQAISSHTTGASNMSMLDKIMYLADMLEENRKFAGVDKLRKLSETDLDEALIISLTESINYIKSKNIKPNSASAMALDFLLERRNHVGKKNSGNTKKEKNV